MKRTLVLGSCLLIARLSACGPAFSADDSRPWWKDYHTLVSHSMRIAGREWELAVMAERGSWPTGWYGPWWIEHQLKHDRAGEAIRRVESFRKRGVKNVLYFDAGEFGQFVALVDAGRLVRNQWQLRYYRGEPGELMWFGKDGFYRDDNPLRLSNYRDFGLPAWTLPNGTRVGSIYDLARTSLDGKRDSWDYSHVCVAPEIARALDLDTFLRQGPDPVPPQANGSLGRICSYDHSNPFLLADFKAGLRLMLSLKPAFLHMDNYFDNETLYPQWHAFGPWSLANFRGFLKNRLTPTQLRQLGIDDPDQFDLNSYIQNKPYRSRGHPWHLQNTQWHDDPIWNLLICSKLADSDRLFRPLYAFCKSESRRLGSEVVVVGNTNPIFPGRALVSGAIDIAHFEHHAGAQFGPVVVPTGLPPLGRLGGVVRLGAAVSAAGYCWPSVYVAEHLSGPGHENLHKVLAMDCLANKGVLDYNHQYREGYSPGSDTSAAWANGFIRSFSSYYGSRTALADIALVFPGQSLLASVSVFTMDPEKSLYDYLGWAQALTDLHFQWDVVPDDQLSDQRLRPFKVVVLPSTACLSDESIAALLGYLGSGGRVVISGNGGTRYGLERFLWHRPSGNTLAARLPGGVTEKKPSSNRSHNGYCFSCSDTPGKTYYLDVADGQRSEGRQQVQQAMEGCLAGTTIPLHASAPTTVGVYTFEDKNRALAVDMVNYNIDPRTDRIQPAGGVQLLLYPPAGRRFSKPLATLISPDLRTASQKTHAKIPLTPWRYEHVSVAGRLRDDGAMDLTIPEFAVFCTAAIPLE